MFPNSVKLVVIFGFISANCHQDVNYKRSKQKQKTKCTEKRNRISMTRSMIMFRVINLPSNDRNKQNKTKPIRTKKAEQKKCCTRKKNVVSIRQLVPRVIKVTHRLVFPYGLEIYCSSFSVLLTLVVWSRHRIECGRAHGASQNNAFYNRRNMSNSTDTLA